MTSSASAPHRVVRNIGLIDNAMFRQIHHRLRFFRRKPMVRAQIFNYRPRIFRADRQAIQPHHPFQRFRPAFRRGALPGNARQIPLLVLRVACPALRNHKGVRYRNTLFHFSLGRRVRSRVFVAAALRRRKWYYAEYRRNQCKPWKSLQCVHASNILGTIYL